MDRFLQAAPTATSAACHLMLLFPNPTRPLHVARQHYKKPRGCTISCMVGLRQAPSSWRASRTEASIHLERSSNPTALLPAGTSTQKEVCFNSLVLITMYHDVVRPWCSKELSSCM